MLVNLGQRGELFLSRRWQVAGRLCGNRQTGGKNAGENYGESRCHGDVLPGRGIGIPASVAHLAGFILG